ncbi:blr8302 [Bradyrhizobium diazoefficiens USDA 110]|uniref:Blr8302 protein n=2 Tax=Bradyrhizobium TaxID=374 RepID=Q89B64_BRADU|nr:hypothetical protein CIT37_14945 [Bradyrhizobium ottawaense]NLS74810.1 hypothetical protein [Bradyrhizobium brasilense]NWL42377.1 hypothetical protein [Bradyrhizobium elkanii]QOZ21470.1 hypothetical protein XI02_04420 [Bradyrhizobium sp. CCBAU 21365]BAC53567.1 blr8302 [Bradyrhizobium diazoefficiens USDA 110]
MRPLSWLVWRCPAYASNGFADLLPRRVPRLPRETRSSAIAVLRCAAALRVQAGRPSPLDRHRDRIGWLRGTVRRNENGSDRYVQSRRRWLLHRHQASDLYSTIISSSPPLILALTKQLSCEAAMGAVDPTRESRNDHRPRRRSRAAPKLIPNRPSAPGTPALWLPSLPR